MQEATRKSPSSQPDSFGKIPDKELTDSYLNILWNVSRDATCNPEGTIGYLTKEEAQACYDFFEEMSEENAELRAKLKQQAMQPSDPSLNTLRNIQRYLFVLEDGELYSSNVVTEEDLCPGDKGYYIVSIVDLETGLSWDTKNLEWVAINRVQSLDP